MSGNLNPNLFRLSLPEWLKEQVGSGNHKGVFWIDEKEKIFHVPWKHASRNGWEDGDVSLFKAWAIYTNRYREGIDKPKPALWKTNFRCAINSHNHIFFVKDQGERRGDQAHRIMKIVDQENCKPNPRETIKYAEPVRKRVRMTYPSSSDQTRKRMGNTTKSNAKPNICDNCGNNYSESCANCRLKLNNNNNNHKHMQSDEKFVVENDSTSDVLSNNETYKQTAIRKPNLQDLCKALQSIDDISTGFDISTMNTNFKNLTSDQTSHLINAIENVKQEIDENDTKFVAHSTRTPVIMSINNNCVSACSLDSDDASVTSDDGDDELIMPRESP